jgi:hypothetical protein
LWQPTDMGHQQIHQNSAAQKEGRMDHKWQMSREL